MDFNQALATHFQAIADLLRGAPSQPPTTIPLPGQPGTPAPNPTPAPGETPPAGVRVIALPFNSRGARTYFHLDANETVALEFTTPPVGTDGRGKVVISASEMSGAGGGTGVHCYGWIAETPGGPPVTAKSGPGSGVTCTVAIAPDVAYEGQLQQAKTYYFCIQSEDGRAGGSMQAYIAPPGWMLVL